MTLPIDISMDHRRRRNRFIKGGVNLLGGELRYLVPIANIERHSSGLAFTMSAHKVLQPVLPSPNRRDLGACLDQTISHRFSNAGRGSNQKEMLVWESHGCYG